MAKRDLYLENLQWIDQQLREGKIGQAEHDLRKARLLAGATRTGPSRAVSAIGIVLAVLLALALLAQVFD